jgi:integrase
MRLERPNKRYQVWLDDPEQQALRDYYSDDIIRQFALRLMLDCGLRSEEVPRVSVGDLDETEAGFSRLKVRESKTTHRETVVPAEVEQMLRMIAQARELGKYDPIVTVTPRTVQNWVTDATGDLADDTDNIDWNKVSAHDLRRTWATDLVQDGVPSDLVMDWGGWEDHSTFREHYWRESDEAVAEHLERIGHI